MALLATQAVAQHDRHHVLGKVHFPVSCSAEAQAAFDEAMKLQHSFWYQASEKKFQEVLRADPTCVMAHWGRALSLLYNPFSPPPANNLSGGLAALQEAQRVGARTDREAGFVDALLAFYRDHDKKDHRTRVLAYEKAMEALAARYPDDPEVRIYYALALNVAASPTDKTYANPLRAAEILEAEWRRQPDHPGIAHYLIHTYDFPALAERGLQAALRYSEIAPDAPHALHMPSHIFTRVGYWPQSVDANTRSAEKAGAANEIPDLLHASDYLVYAYLQMGRDQAAKRIIEDRERYRQLKMDRSGGPFALAAMPARYAMERGAWVEAASLEVQPTAFPFVDAITHYARAVGLARSGKPVETSAEVEALQKLVVGLNRDPYWKEQVDIQRQSAEAWVAFARGQREEALGLMRAAAEREAKTEKHAVTPGPLAPARELLAEMLMEMNRPAEALQEFEAVQKNEPNRFRAVSGAARAAEQAGNREIARAQYGKLAQIAANADTARPELEAAKKYLAN
jgi:predicted Zn-dependent protease